MKIEEIAKEGLNKLELGEIGINIDALNEKDAEFLKEFYISEGYSVKVGEPYGRGDKGTVYPVNVLLMFK